MREVPRKNYIILGVLALSVIVICLIFTNIYKKNNSKIYNSEVKDIINEIKYEDLDNYLLENPDVVLYINDSTKKLDSIDRKFKNIIVDNNIQQYVVYIEKNKKIIKKWNLDNNNNPIFIAYSNGKVFEILSEDDYTEDDLNNFLIRNGVLEDA